MVAQLDSTFLRFAPARAASRLVGYSLFEGRPLTTRGRWWNPVVLGHLRLAANWAGKQVDRPVFIVGMGRSGTTLLGRILAVHPSVGFLNEPKAMWHVIRDDEDVIGSYASPHTGRLYLDGDDANEQVVRRGRALFSWYLLASRSKRVVDKYPELVFRHAFVRAIFADARFVIALRAPWPTLRSVAKWSQTNASHESDWWGLRDQKWDILWREGVLQRPSNVDLAALDLRDERDHHVRAAVEWVVTMRQSISLAAVDPVAKVVRYDELVVRPRETIRKTLEACELSPSPRTEAYAEAIVSGQESARDKGELAARLPDALVKMIEETWSGLDAVC